MKIRQSFVSNSSSASFALAKAYMTDEQVKKFRDFISFLDDYESNNYDDKRFNEYLNFVDKYDIFSGEGEVSPTENGKYFVGEIDQSVIAPISNYLDYIGVNREDWVLED